MSRKNFLFLGLVVLLCGILVSGCFQSKPKEKPATFVLNDFSPTTEDFIVADEFNGAENYAGPYGGAVVESGTLKFDVAAAWCTLNFINNEQFNAGGANTFKYAVITLRADNPEDAAKATMT
ncbi:MAG: hypothetical protein ACUVRM_06645, partial [Bacillota bacterium]